jgi:hypothetical protein
VETKKAAKRPTFLSYTLFPIPYVESKIRAQYGELDIKATSVERPNNL